MKKIAVLTGAGISAESGLKTFRDSDGLWEGYRPEDVATPEAWQADPQRVLQFYNERREQVRAAQPNAAHLALVELERFYEVTIITQNIDDLHERAGSSQVLHLHGEILKSQSTADPRRVYEISGRLEIGDCCELGSQLRPFVVWFGEAVPAMEQAVPVVEAADAMLVIGTSLAVYPAAGLVSCMRRDAPVYLVDPRIPEAARDLPNARLFPKPAAEGVRLVVDELLSGRA